jgi:hypothetical protein
MLTDGALGVFIGIECRCSFEWMEEVSWPVPLNSARTLLNFSLYQGDSWM